MVVEKQILKGILGLFIIAAFFSCGCIDMEKTPIYESQPVYESRAIYESQPVYESRPMYEQQRTYGQQEVYEDRYDINLMASGWLCDNVIVNRKGLTYNEYLEWYDYKEEKADYCKIIWKVDQYTVFVGYETVHIGWEDVLVGYESIFVGYEDVIVGYEDIIVRYEDVIVGYE